MKFSNKRLFNTLKVVILLLAIGNLIALFVFDYQLPDSLTQKNTVSSEEELCNSDSKSFEGTSCSFHFESDPIIYDGKEKLDLLNGVSLVSSSGEEISNSEIFTHIKTGSSISKKIIEYSVETENGQVKAHRNLELSGYNGPTIKCPDSLPSLEDSQLDSVLFLMPKDGSFVAEDGYGNDITKSIKSSYKRDTSDSNLIHFTFTVTNSFNDTVSAQRDFQLVRTKPLIILKEKVLSISANSPFNALEQVSVAEDIDGSSLFNSIIINGSVDTHTPGKYILTYSVSSPSGSVSDPVELEVIVK